MLKAQLHVFLFHLQISIQDSAEGKGLWGTKQEFLSIAVRNKQIFILGLLRSWGETSDWGELERRYLLNIFLLCQFNLSFAGEPEMKKKTPNPKLLLQSFSSQYISEYSLPAETVVFGIFLIARILSEMTGSNICFIDGQKLEFLFP